MCNDLCGFYYLDYAKYVWLTLQWRVYDNKQSARNNIYQCRRWDAVVKVSHAVTYRRMFWFLQAHSSGKHCRIDVTSFFLRWQSLFTLFSPSPWRKTNQQNKETNLYITNWNVLIKVDGQGRPWTCVDNRSGSDALTNWAMCLLKLFT